MFLKTLSLYGGFRLFSVIAGLFQIFIITKKFGINGYGDISLIYAYAAYINIFTLQWLSKITARVPGDINFNRALLSIHIAIGIILIIISFFMEIIIEYASLLVLVAFVDSLKEHILEYFRSNLKIKAYGLLNFIYAFGGITFLIISFKIDLKIEVFIFLFYIINLIILFFYLFKHRLLTCKANHYYRINNFYIKYGYSISLSNSISQFAFSGVRIFIGNRFGSETLGIFSIIYDFLQRSIVSYMQIINSATFPLMRNSWDDKDISQLDKYLRMNFSLLIYLPMLGILILVNFNEYLLSLLNVNIGSIKFDMKSMILVVGLGVIFNRIKTFHVDYFLLFLYKSNIIFKITTLSMIILAILLFLFRENENIIFINVSVTFAYLLSLGMSFYFGISFLRQYNSNKDLVRVKIIKINEFFLFLVLIIILCLATVFQIESIIFKILLITIIFILTMININLKYMNLKKVTIYDN